MRIETARDTDHRHGRRPARQNSRDSSGCSPQWDRAKRCRVQVVIIPPMASTQGAFAGGRFLGFFWKRPVQVPSTARSATCIPYVSRSKRRLYRHPKPQRGVKDQTEPQAQARGQAAGQLRTQKRRRGNTEREKAIMQQKMRTNRSAMHHAPALRRIAGCSLQARGKLSVWRGAAAASASLSSSSKPNARQASSPARLSTTGSAPAKKHPQPPRNCTVSGTFQPENSRKKGNTYYKQNRQTTHSYTTYGNTRGSEKGKIAETLSYPDIFCHNIT